MINHCLNTDRVLCLCQPYCEQWHTDPCINLPLTLLDVMKEKSFHSDLWHRYRFHKILYTQTIIDSFRVQRNTWHDVRLTVLTSITTNWLIDQYSIFPWLFACWLQNCFKLFALKKHLVQFAFHHNNCSPIHILISNYRGALMWEVWWTCEIRHDLSYWDYFIVWLIGHREIPFFLQFNG